MASSEVTGWRQSETITWIAHDSPTPPRVRRWTQLTLAAALGGVLAAMLSTDTLCPEHRLLVMAFGLVSIAAAVTAFVQLLRNRWIAAPLTLVSAIGGAICGTIDMTHDQTRGSLIASGFVIVAVAAAFMAVTDLRRFRWDRELLPKSLPSLRDAVTDSDTQPRPMTQAAVRDLDRDLEPAPEHVHVRQMSDD